MFWFLLACNKADECNAGSLSSGQAQATIEGDGWSDSNVTWNWAGSSLQITSQLSEGWRLSLVAQESLEGDALADAVDAGDFPIEVDLDAGGFGILYQDGGFSYASNDGGGGTLTISEADDAAVACFDFDAKGSDASVISLVGGAVNAKAN